MGENSKISWTDHTFNPWWGCVKCMRGCEACYADSLAIHYGFDVWGKDKPRRLFGEKHWNEPAKWNRKAEKEGRRAKVFCGSMCDLFEIHAVPEWEARLELQRLRLWMVIAATPFLDWLLLTKRPENSFRTTGATVYDIPRNVWFGVSASDQKEMESQWSVLDSETHYMLPSKLFLSLEPLLGPIDVGVLEEIDAGDEEHEWWTREPDWIIIGCQSNGSRLGSLGDFKTEEDWLAGVRNILHQCKEFEIPAFVKQIPLDGKLCKNPDEWPEDLRVQEFPL